jgi:hypothetical protein
MQKMGLGWGVDRGGKMEGGEGIMDLGKSGGGLKRLVR